MSQEPKTFKFSSVELIQFAWEKRLPLLIISFAAAVLSIIYSFTIEEKYKSSVVLFPAPATSVSKSLMTDEYAGRQTLLEFGEEEQSEQMLQILNSDQIRNRIIQKYDLLNHYEINPNQKYRYSLLTKKFNGNIKFKRTKYMSVVIEVMDKDPQIAANIANDIASLFDTAMIKIQRERAIVALQTVEKEYRDFERQINKLEDSLNVLRSLGVYDYQSQSEALSSAYSAAVSQNNQKELAVINQQLKNLAKYGGAYMSIYDFLVYEKENLSRLKAKYAEARVDAEQSLPAKYIVDNAVPADRKSYPKKSLIVLQSTMAAFFISYIILLILSIIKVKND